MQSHPPAEGDGHGKASQEDVEVTAVEHAKYLARSASEYLADAYLLSAVFALEHGQPEHSYHADEDGEQGEQQYLPGESHLVAVVRLDNLVDEAEVEVVSRCELLHRPLQFA